MVTKIKIPLVKPELAGNASLTERMAAKKRGRPKGSKNRKRGHNHRSFRPMKLLDPQEQEDGQRALLATLITAFGGPVKCAEKFKKILGVDFSRNRGGDHVLINWRVRGKVPLSKCLRLADALEISEYALNYKGLAKILKRAPKWAEVVESCSKHLLPVDVQYIFKFAKPAVPKGTRIYSLEPKE